MDGASGVGVLAEVLLCRLSSTAAGFLLPPRLLPPVPLPSDPLLDGPRRRGVGARAACSAASDKAIRSIFATSLGLGMALLSFRRSRARATMLRATGLGFRGVVLVLFPLPPLGPPSGGEG